MYKHKHPLLPPSFITNNNKKYIVPGWQQVPLNLKLEDIIWDKPNLNPTTPPKNENTWTFESSSDPGQFYRVRQVKDKLICDCSGYWRSRGNCKHVKEINLKLKK
jgi:hypothetical protein